MSGLRFWLQLFALVAAGLLLALSLRDGTNATALGGWASLLERLSGPPASDVQEPPAREPVLGAESAKLPPRARFDHTALDQQVCARPHSKARNDVQARLVYRWKDINGQTHLSDKRPEGIIASVLDMGMAVQDFSYRLVPEGISLPSDFAGKVAAGSKRMYDVWHFLLGEDKLRQSRIDLLLVADAARFAAYRAMTSADTFPIGGFYSMRSNQAFVKADPAQPARNLQVAYHEVSHLITASHLGPTPPWLTEGLAEYFETMQVRDQMGAVYPNLGHVRLLRSQALPPLRAYLSMDRLEWYGEQRSRNYAMAWALMHFLLEGSPGMYALQRVVREMEAHFCQPFSALQALDEAYPGGLSRLEADWRHWLANERFGIQQT